MASESNSSTRTTRTSNTTTLGVLQTTVENALKNALPKAIENVVLEAIKNAVANAVSTSMSSMLDEVRSLRHEIAELRTIPSKESVRNAIMPTEPLTTVEQVLEFEKILQNETAYIQFKKDLSEYNKYSGSKYVRSIWRALMTDQCAENFSWSGTLEKKSVRHLRMSLALRDVFIHKVHGKEHEFISGTKTFFQFAKNRQKQRGKTSKDLFHIKISDEDMFSAESNKSSASIT